VLARRYGVTTGQSARNFYINFLQFAARYRRARWAMLSAQIRWHRIPVSPPVFTGVRAGGAPPGSPARRHGGVNT
jgi:hypothetical protein